MYYDGKRPGSLSRWRIHGTLRTESPLHIGDGRTERVKDRACQTGFLDDDANPFYAMVMTTRDGCPVIPGTSLKGALHAWAVAHVAEPDLIRETFGSADRGGIVTFHDAKPAKTAPKPENPAYRMWCEGRSTSLTPQVVINPRTRSAEESLLYYVEYVPAGVEFAVSFTAQGASDRQRGLLLHVLDNAFKSAYRPARLGSEGANGWGCVQWLPGDFQTMDLEQWLKVPVAPWVQSLKTIEAGTRTQWLAEAVTFPTCAGGDTLTLKLTLDFEGPMLVNDPSRKKKASGEVEGAGDSVGHATIRTHSGAVYLPAQSVRGAFRAQARRIWQTLFHGDEPQNLDGNRDTDVRGSRSQKQLAAFLKLFGSTGWRSPIEIGDFELIGDAVPCPQEFVAIDRFTGGVSGKKKFNAQGVWKPRFAGTVRIRKDRLFAVPGVAEDKDTSAGAGPWVWMLLAWTLRDWAEGDGSIGFGRSKGYGRFRAVVTSTEGGTEGALMRRILQRDGVALDSAEMAAWDLSVCELLKHGEVA